MTHLIIAIIAAACGLGAGIAIGSHAHGNIPHHIKEHLEHLIHHHPKNRKDPQ